MKRHRVEIALGLLCGLLALAGSCSDRTQQPAEPAGTTRAGQPQRPSPPAAERPATHEAAPGPPPAPQPPTVTRPSLRRVHVFIRGRVQGVGFRAFTRHEARVLGLTGWVRNLRDGRVEAVIEGPAEKVRQLLVKVKTGPPAARVDGVEATDETYKGEFDAFEVRF